MRFHIPSFLHHLEEALPENVGGMHHHYIYYLHSTYPIRKDFLQEVITQAVIDSYETPLGTPDSTEESSPIKGLLDTHERTLRRTLLRTDTYLKAFRNQDETGERLTAYEYHIDVYTIQSVCIESIAGADKALIQHELLFDETASVRKIQKKLYVKRGKVYGSNRVNRVLQVLEDEGFLNSNGHVRISGRDVVRNTC